MCLSTVLEKRGDLTTTICKDIADVRVNSDEVTFVDIMGITTKYKGVINRIDLTDNIIWVHP